MTDSSISSSEYINNQVQAKYRVDYTAPEFLIPETNLAIVLSPTATKVVAKLQIQRNGSHAKPLVLHSEVDAVVSIVINGRELDVSEYSESPGQLSIKTELTDFELIITSTVNPQENTALEGLYLSGGAYCTQCEAEGFRRITPFLDRPDVLSTFTVSIDCDEKHYPHALSNGNLIKKERLDNNGLTRFTWSDPHPKPSYLFAMVAGNFDLLSDRFVTSSGREVGLEIYVDKGNVHLADHAMSSLKKSMAWDQEKYGLEYDLDVYMIVAVDFFNMGAMENKGLNIFNSKYVLADENTATDMDYHGVEAVIAHEYFHNWTGNRVTCRDWFQLSLKEGLTVFRDQQFSADMGTPVIERISHANVMRTMQFAEDSGPMSHPIRPDKVIEMNNFYTVTVYDKGAEVIRMMNTTLGEDGFRKGMDLYFSRHDGQAVTCDDFVASMADANNVDLSRFARWYSQSGTPQVTVQETVTENGHVIDFCQSIYGRIEPFDALTIPIKYEVLDKVSGECIESGTFILEEHTAQLNINTQKPVVVVLFEDFSAPVKVKRELSLDDMQVIITHASDDFCRWDMLQTLWQMAVSNGLNSNESEVLLSVLQSIAEDKVTSQAVKAELLKVPSFQSLAESFETINVTTILDNRSELARRFVEMTTDKLMSELTTLSAIDNGYDKNLVAKRSLKSVLLQLLSFRDTDKKIANVIVDSFSKATNMTDKMSALQAAQNFSLDLLETLLEQLYSEFKGQALVFDKMSQLVAMSKDDGVYELMKKWSERPEFDRKNPNRMRSLYGAFVMRNPQQFHHVSGKGYAFLEKLLIEIDAMNPQLAARLIDPLLAFKRYEPQRSQLMLGTLESLSKMKLSKDLYEKVQAAISR